MEDGSIREARGRFVGLPILRDLLLGFSFAVIGIVLRASVEPWLADRETYAIAIGWVAIGGWLISIRAGVITAAVGAVPAMFLFDELRLGFAVPDPAQAMSLAIYALACAAILICEARALRLIDREQTATRALEELNRRKDEFLSLLSHELRNPVNAMVLAGEVFRARAQEDDKLKTAIKIHDRQSRQAMALMDDLLDVARITRGRVDLKRQRHDVRLCVQDAVDENIRMIESKRQAIDLALPQAPLMAIVDPVRVTQIVSNLINNAGKYSPETTLVSVRAERVGEEVVVTVRDQGQGIAPSVLPNIFDWFFTHVSSDKPGTHGLGVGLWLCNQLALLHDGSLRATSEGVGKGSQFELRLPVGEAAERRREVRPRTPFDEDGGIAGRP